MQLTWPTAACHNALPVASASSSNFELQRRHRLHIGSLGRFPTVNINKEFGTWPLIEPGWWQPWSYIVRSPTTPHGRSCTRHARLHPIAGDVTLGAYKLGRSDLR
jgi:hypothetical protein